MRGRPWTMNDKIDLTVQYLGMVPVKKIARNINRTERSVYNQASYLGLKTERLERVSQKKHERALKSNKGLLHKKFPQLKTRPGEEMDWKVYHLRHTTNLNNREIGERLGLTKSQVQRYLHVKGLAMHPPAGEPPVWFQEHSK